MNRQRSSNFTKEPVAAVALPSAAVLVHKSAALPPGPIPVDFYSKWANATSDLECIFDKPVHNLSQLSPCLYVKGDLNLVNGATGSASSRILSAVNGSVYLADVEEERLGFLNGTNVTGQIKSDLCDFVTLFGKAVQSPPCPPTTVGATTLPTTTTMRPTASRPLIPPAGSTFPNSTAASTAKKDGLSGIIGTVVLGLAFLVVLGLLLYCRCCPGCSKEEKQGAHKPSPRPVRDSKKNRRRSKHTENGSSETTSKGESAETVSTTGKTTAGRRRSQPRNITAESVSTGSSTPQIGTSRDTTTGSVVGSSELIRRSPPQLPLGQATVGRGGSDGLPRIPSELTQNTMDSTQPNSQLTSPEPFLEGSAEILEEPESRPRSPGETERIRQGITSRMVDTTKVIRVELPEESTQMISGQPGGAGSRQQSTSKIASQIKKKNPSCQILVEIQSSAVVSTKFCRTDVFLSFSLLLLWWTAAFFIFLQNQATDGQRRWRRLPGPVVEKQADEESRCVVLLVFGGIPPGLKGKQRSAHNITQYFKNLSGIRKKDNRPLFSYAETIDAITGAMAFRGATPDGSSPLGSPFHHQQPFELYRPPLGTPPAWYPTTFYTDLDDI